MSLRRAVDCVLVFSAGQLASSSSDRLPSLILIQSSVPSLCGPAAAAAGGGESVRCCE